MMTSTVLVWILVCVTIISLSVACLATVLVFKTSQNAVHSIGEAHRRNQEHTEGLVDRIVSGDYGTYKAYELMDKKGDTPIVDDGLRDEQPVGSVRGGFGSRLGLAAMGDRVRL